jgi:hypothetical protein
MKNMNPTIRLGVTILGIGLTGCARDSVSLGDDSLAAPLVPSEGCSSDPIMEGDVRITEQAALDALAGCEEVSGNLTIEVFPGTDLRPLASLRTVGGQLFIGDRSSTRDVEEYLGLVEAGWLESFDGLQALERVGALALVNFAASDLSELSSLRSVNAAAPENRTRAGYLVFQGARNLVNLQGLERVGGVESLMLLDLPALESLDGLTVSYRFDNIMIQGAPRLTDLEALAPLERGNSLSISETAVEDLWALASLVDVRQFFILNNPLLADTSSIPRTRGLFLQLENNPKLQGTLEVSSASMNGFMIAGNAALERISFNANEVHMIPWVCGSVRIFGNEKLRAVSSPDGCDQHARIEVSNNPNLETLDLGRLKRLDELHIVDNPSLSALSHTDFERIYVIDVVNNPRLSTSALASVPAFERTLEGNAD